MGELADNVNWEDASDEPGTNRPYLVSVETRDVVSHYHRVLVIAADEQDASYMAEGEIRRTYPERRVVGSESLTLGTRSRVVIGRIADDD
jgi:hypothetical protein